MIAARPPAGPGRRIVDEQEPDDVTLPTEDAIDLHAFAPRDVADVVASYLEAVVAAGFREVRIIHGRGIGAQRDTVRSVLSRHPRVAAFADAPPDRGGWGATVVLLK